MYNIKDFVMHKSEGICIVDEIAIKNYGSGDAKYYIMHKYFCRQNENCKVMLPVDTCHQIRNILEKDEAAKVLNNINNAKYIWKREDKRKKETFTEIIFHGDIQDLSNIIYTINKLKFDNKDSKKGLPLTDKTVVNFVEKSITEELAVSLDIMPEDVIKLINEKLEF